MCCLLVCCVAVLVYSFDSTFVQPFPEILDTLFLSAVGVEKQLDQHPSSFESVDSVVSLSDFTPMASEGKIRGVNLGGWLLLEPWITPSLFNVFLNKPADQQAVDEYTLCTLLGPDEASRTMHTHWSTFITAADFDGIAAAGLTHVRIPLGYWSIEIERGEPFVLGSMVYLLRAIEWARNKGIKVMIDLHGAPGSQNGFDNSGRRGPVHWSDQVAVAQQSNDKNTATTTAGASTQQCHVMKTMSVEKQSASNESIEVDFESVCQRLSAERRRKLEQYPHILRTVRVLLKLADRFDRPEFAGVVTHLELLNEPLYSVDLDLVKEFYLSAIQGIRQQNPNSQLIITMHDSFRLLSWAGFAAENQMKNTMFDTHHYQVFSVEQLKWSNQQHLNNICRNMAEALRNAVRNNGPTVVGEWSGATTDCALWLNGFAVGSRWEGSMPANPVPIGQCSGNYGNDPAQWSEEFKIFLKQYIESQMGVYEREANGWFFWTWKTDAKSPSPHWDFQRLLQLSIVPQPLTHRQFDCSQRS